LGCIGVFDPPSPFYGRVIRRKGIWKSREGPVRKEIAAIGEEASAAWPEAIHPGREETVAFVVFSPYRPHWTIER
jgi:hypothetical protein